MKISWCFVLLLVGVGCTGGQARVDEAQRTVRSGRGERSVSYQFGTIPASWRRVEIEGNDAAWHDTESHGVVHVDHTCERNQDTPLTALVQQLLIGFTERTFELEELVPLDGREARHVRVRARLDGVPMQLELYVMKKDGCVFDLGIVAPPDHFTRASAGFQEFVRGFHTITTGAMDAQERR